MSKVTDWKTPIGKSSTYDGVFDGNGYSIKNLKYKPTQQANQARALFGKIGKTAIIRNLGISGAKVTAETSSQVDTNIAVLAGNNSGYIYNCYVIDSEVSVETKSAPNIGVLCSVNNGKIENCYCINSTIKDTSTITTSGVYGGIAGANTGTVKNSYAVSITFSICEKNTITPHPVSSSNTENVYYSKATGDARTYTGGTEKDTAWFKSDAAVDTLGKEYFAKDGTNKNNGYPVLTFKNISVGGGDKTALENALKVFPTKGYYTTNDRYNGVSTSVNGFWNDMQKLAASARAVYGKENATDAEIQAEVKKLQDSADAIQKAIANLIPTTRANTTLLYEAMQHTVSKDRYTPVSYAAFTKAYDEASALMASMFDEKGNPTDANTSANGKQETLEALAKKLEAAWKDLDERVSYNGTSGEKQATLTVGAIRYLLDKAAGVKRSVYTQDTLSALDEAVEQAKKTLATDEAYSSIGQKELQRMTAAMQALRKAIYGLKTDSQGKIHVQLSVVDASDIHLKHVGLSQALHNPNLLTKGMTLDANASAYDILNTSCEKGGTLLTGYNTTNGSEPLLFLNGELVYGENFAGYSNTDEVLKAIRLHNGDALTLVRIWPSRIQFSSQVGYYSELMMDIPSYFRYSTIEAPTEVTAGEPFTIRVTSTSALPFAVENDSKQPVVGASIYRTSAAATEDEVSTAYGHHDTYAVTDENGETTLTLYYEGYTLINAYQVDDIQGHYTVGPSVLVYVKPSDDLAAVKLQLRKELDEAYYDENYPESIFTPENWQKVKQAYETGVQAIADADNSGAASSAQESAVNTIRSLQKSAVSQNNNNLKKFRDILAKLPDDVTKLDKSAETDIANLKAAYEAMTDYQQSELTEQEIARYEEIINAKLNEAESYELKFEQAFAEDVPEADQQTIRDMIAYLKEHTRNEDQYTDVTGGNKLAELFTFNTYVGGPMVSSANNSYIYTPLDKAPALKQDIYACVSPEYAAYLLCRDAAIQAGKNNGPGVISAENGSWSISDESTQMYVPDASNSNTTRVLGKMTYTINGTKYAIRSIKVTGLDTEASKRTLSFYDDTGYKGRSKGLMCNQVVPDTFLAFDMPFNNVTITVTWGPASGSASEVEKARADALTALETVMKGYEGNTKYTDKLDEIKKAYEAGIAKIKDKKQTPTVDAINTARRETASKMAKAAAGSSSSADYEKYWGPNGLYRSEFDPGTEKGSVTLIIEDTTYDDSKDNDGEPFFYTGPTTAADYSVKNAYVYKENYIIGDNDTMMTVILRALKEKNCSWTGTGGTEFGITYLSGIKDGDHKLSEFDGGKESGWMGTLNGFFVNLSFAEFRVTPKEGQESKILLEDGDVIHVMYTCTGLGADLGGTWGNSDTTLKALKVESGTETLVLAPEFEAVAEPGGTYSYTVLIDDEAADLTITADAANKNYLVKRFLNEKVTDNTEGGSFYKSTQAIPVVSGDTIYIGCGEPVWPSMNNQSTEAREYVGTWYELHIVSKKSGTKDVEAQIDALPDVGSLTYANRENYRQDILQAWRALNELADPDAVINKDKLDQLYKKLTDFDAVDAVKQAIADLPTVANATLADKSNIDAAKAKYDALTDELRTYLKASEKQKLADLLKRIEELNQEALTRLVVSPDTVSAVVDAKTGTIRLVGYVTPDMQIRLNDTPVANGDSFTLGYSTYRIDMSGVIEKAPNVELEEKRPEIKMPEGAGDEVKQAVNAITSPSTTSDGLKEAAAETLTETAKDLAKDAAANAKEGQTVEVTAEVNLKIEVTRYSVSDGKNELALEIKPQVTYTTVVKNADGTTASSKTTDAEDLGNHVINAPVTISLALPTGMSQENLYVKHQISEDRYEYIKPTIEKNVATWQQSSFSVVILTSDRRTATIEMDGANETLTPEDIGKELPTVSMPNKDFLGWTFVINGEEYPGGPYTELTDDLLTKLSEADSVSATPVFKDRPIIPVTPVTPSKPSQKPDTGKDLPFTDVSANSWFYDGVKYAYENGLMNGTSSTAFSPNANTTRGMIVTILARVEGVNTNGTPWYAAGQKWAMDNGISDGTNMPGVITREQLATILYRYAKQKGYDVSKSAALTAFSDADKVSGYAAEAMQWAVAEGLLQGSNGRLNPQGSATRAQVATILMRFMEKIAK